ncbi:MAG: type IV pilus twitching motility protein PilT [Pseudomonadota bacterium]|nr:type IV pilus twitching motility protein PilT [Pseudomonadota bacterium]
MDITDLLVFTQKNNASDLHLSTGSPPILRIHGEIIPYKSSPLTADDVRQMLSLIMTEQQRAEYERDLDLDFAISFRESIRFRVSAFHTLNGPAAVLRLIPERIPSFEELGAPEVIKKLCRLHKGLVLLAGPAGSGKSTLMAAMVDYINNHEAKHIITIEDPVEFVHRSQQSLINQREVGRSTRSFAAALRSAVREDPDVIMVGEMRDIETIQLALTAAETGHLVFSTLHTDSAPRTIDRIIDVFPAHDKEMARAMLAASLEAVITQTLLKRKSKGRVAAHEVMLGTPAARNLIREGKMPQLYSLIQTGARLGMRTMKDSVQELVRQDVISEQTARAELITGATDEDADVLQDASRRSVQGSQQF